jgi:DNA-directed RNA polymerase subunit E'/Rpb7
MFYRLYNLFTKLVLSPEEIAFLGSTEYVMGLVVQKLEGRCFADLGYLIKILAPGF